MSDIDITSKTMDGMGPHGTKVGLLRVLGPAHVWALGVGIVLVGWRGDQMSFYTTVGVVL